MYELYITYSIAANVLKQGKWRLQSQLYLGFAAMTEQIKSLLQLAVSETIITLYGTSGIWHQGMPVSHFCF